MVRSLVFPEMIRWGFLWSRDLLCFVLIFWFFFCLFVCLFVLIFLLFYNMVLPQMIRSFVHDHVTCLLESGTKEVKTISM